MGSADSFASNAAVTPSKNSAQAEAPSVIWPSACVAPFPTEPVSTHSAGCSSPAVLPGLGVGRYMP